MRFTTQILWCGNTTTTKHSRNPLPWSRYPKLQMKTGNTYTCTKKNTHTRACARAHTHAHRKQKQASTSIRSFKFKSCHHRIRQQSTARICAYVWKWRGGSETPLMERSYWSGNSEGIHTCVLVCACVVQLCVCMLVCVGVCVHVCVCGLCVCVCACVPFIHNLFLSHTHH